ncbi:MAG: DUF4097 family beta strand repeat protein [Planctomycetes bacterium]|nr:DUF4097 family beta strand repeat protein [Planctomycetota bacterium]
MKRRTQKSLWSIALFAGLLTLAPACYYKETRISGSGGVMITTTGGMLGDVKLDSVAERTVDLPLDFAAGSAFRTELRAGDVEVVSAENSAHVEVTISATGRTKAEAEAVLARFEPRTVADERGARFEVQGEALEIHEGNTTYRIEPHVKVRAHVPDGSQLAIETSSGNIVVDGEFQKTDLKTEYGSVTVARVHGRIEAKTSSGNIGIRATRGDRVRAETQYGSVTCEDIRAESLVLSSSSGNITVHSSTGSLRANTEYGAIDLTECEGSVEATTSSGNIKLEGGRGESTSLRTEYGSIRCSSITGSIRAVTSSGNVRLEDVAASVDAKTSYGHIDCVIDATFAGSIRARTEYGQVTSGIDIADREQSKDKRSLRGRIGQGTANLELEASSGNITLATR